MRNPIDPPAALRSLAARMDPLPPVERPLDDAPAGWLAAAPAGLEAAGERRATRNGYGLPAGARPGEERQVRGTLAAEGLDPGVASGIAAGGNAALAEGRRDESASVWRIETGARVPPEVESILPVAWAVITGEGKVRIERLPPPGHGILPPTGGSGPRTPIAGGMLLDGRLRAVLHARGVRSVLVRPPFEVAFGTVGDELVDLHSPLDEGQRHDVTAPWLEDAITGLGLTPVPLGIVDDSPATVRDAILRVRSRKVDVLVLAGGLGEGVTDRTFEALTRFEMAILFHGVSIEGASGLLFAKSSGLDIVGLGGKPLEAAAGFDLFLRPALLARLGAPRPRWDWTLARHPLDGASPQGDAGSSAGSWSARPAARVPSRGGEVRIIALDAPSPFDPCVPGQDGWAVCPPGAAPAGWCHFLPL